MVLTFKCRMAAQAELLRVFLYCDCWCLINLSLLSQSLKFFLIVCGRLERSCSKTFHCFIIFATHLFAGCSSVRHHRLEGTKRHMEPTQVLQHLMLVVVRQNFHRQMTMKSRSIVKMEHLESHLNHHRYVVSRYIFLLASLLLR